jgi:hypothetical protein
LRGGTPRTHNGTHSGFCLLPVLHPVKTLAE